MIRMVMSIVSACLIRNHWAGIVVILLLMSSVSCKREVQEIIVTDTAEVKRIEAIKETQVKDAEAAEAACNMKIAENQRLAARDSLRAAEVSEKAAVSKQLEQEAQLAREQLAYSKELAEQKKALEDEVSAIATASNTISVFVADLRSRQGRLQLKQKSLPNEIKQCRDDLSYLMGFLSSCRQVVVTNVSYYDDPDTKKGSAKVFDIKTVTRKPDEYVKAVKADKTLNSILSRYNNEAFAFELDKVVAELAYENKRLSTSWAMLVKGRNTYSSKLIKANTGSRATTSELEATLEKVKSRIKALEVRISSFRKGFRELSSAEEMNQAMEELGQNGAYPTGLYAEKQRLQRMLEMAQNTEEHADASSAGIGSNFDLQEKGLRDEYEANVRRAFDNVERTVLHAVTDNKEQLEKEQTIVQSDLAAIQLILDAHVKGQIGQRDMLMLHSKFTNSVTESLTSAANQILK